MTLSSCAERAHARDGEAGRAQRLHHPVFAVDLVGAGAGAAPGGFLRSTQRRSPAVSRKVGLEAPRLNWRTVMGGAKPSRSVAQPGRERRLVEAVVGPDLADLGLVRRSELGDRPCVGLNVAPAP